MSYLFNSVCLLASRTKNLRNVIKYIRGHSHNQIILFRILSTTPTKMSSTNLHFKGKEDRYKGIIVDSEVEGCTDITEFIKKLEDSLKIWRTKEFRGIWFKVHLNQSEWVPVLAKNGFKYHHAKDEYVMMYLWLPKTENANIPHYAHTMLGVGAVVVNDKNEVLTVREKYSILNKVYYKLPGGYVEPGENIIDAAIREVHEETNIKTEFQSVLSLRHAHGAPHKCSDLYVVLQLKPLMDDIVKSDREIVEAKWMDIKEFLNNPQVIQTNKFYLRKYLEYKERGIKINSFHGMYEIINKPYIMYSVVKDDVEEQEAASTSLKHKQ